MCAKTGDRSVDPRFSFKNLKKEKKIKARITGMSGDDGSIEQNRVNVQQLVKKIKQDFK